MTRIRSTVVHAFVILFLSFIGLGDPTLSAAQRSASPTPAEWQTISRVLEQRVSIDAVERPLHTIVSQLSAIVGYPLYIDRLGLEDIGLGIDQPITLQVDNVSLETALGLIVPNELSWTVYGNMIFVTSIEECESHPVVLTYSLANAELNGTRSSSLQRASSRIIEIIESTIDPACWDRYGGYGSIHYYEPKNLLVVSQTPQVHRELERLLAQLNGSSSRTLRPRHGDRSIERQSQRYQPRQQTATRRPTPIDPRRVPSRLGGGLF